MVKSKEKGSAYEREICRQLSLWWSEGRSDDLFWRSAGSGAMAKTRSKQGKKTASQNGDISAVDGQGASLLKVFSIELKRGYNKESILDSFEKNDKTKKEWESFLEQSKQDAKNAEALSWLLIWRKDRKIAMIYTSSLTIKQLIKQGSKLKNIPHLIGKVQLRTGKKVGIYISRLDDFLFTVKPKHIKGLIK